MSMFKNLFLYALAISLLASCSSGIKGKANYPKSKEEREVEKVGKLTGEDGIVLFGKRKSRSGATEGINVNSYLWRATLDTVYFMPLISADPFGGTVLTDWYSENSDSNERYKVNIFIIGAELRTDALKVSVFKQVKKNGKWENKTISEAMASEIEDKIFTRARQIKIGDI